MAGLVLCEPTELYNILNQVTKLSRLTEPNYLCLLDVRSKREYDESHVITARRVKKRANEYLLPGSVDLECVKYCVVYDNNTSTLEIALGGEDEDSTEDRRHELVPGAAVECGRALAHLTHHPICILKGGYERFSATYHFLRTQKIIWMPQELDAFQPYPVEIIPGKIYLGNFRQACDPKIQKDLKIKAHVNVSMETGPFFVDDSDKLLHIKIEDSLEANIFPFLRHLCHFLEIHLRLGSVILVFSTLGISRSCAATLAFLMHWKEQTLKRSFRLLNGGAFWLLLGARELRPCQGSKGTYSNSLDRDRRRGWRPVTTNPVRPALVRPRAVPSHSTRRWRPAPRGGTAFA
ncbi:serine/threonine/tyrosine-interacting-like protein 1 isoform X1 [Eumetopias jubatus]|uniref:serine/threonine/tyrosine-interacting-like protein 1 isoform X1 n=1 Tax=Eumetopias jubatus TaxID=34886 RepID=UPI00101609F0|nr:serine/threonine/tyrosine-interacting-like protein 1 isoform X1 [Eumetopias jubatus]